MFGMFRIKLVVIIGGIALFVFGAFEWQLKMVAKETPQTIPAAQLAANGPGDNANVRVTNFYICAENFVYEEDEKTHDWSKVWVPLVPAGQSPDMGNVRIIVQDKICRSEFDVAGMNGAPSINGLIVNRISSLGKEERNLLSETYPGTDFSTCYILDRDRQPMSSAGVLGMMGGGGFVALLGLAWMVQGYRS